MDLNWDPSRGFLICMSEAEVGEARKTITYFLLPLSSIALQGSAKHATKLVRVAITLKERNRLSVQKRCLLGKITAANLGPYCVIPYRYPIAFSNPMFIRGRSI